MTLIYALIAKGTTILAKYQACAGNFAEVMEQILVRIPEGNSKLTHSHNSYLFHHIKEDGIVYLCISDDLEFERTRAFMFLLKIKSKFEQTYGASRIRDALPYSMSDFSSVLSSEMRRCTGDESSDKISKVEEQVDELRDIFEKDIDNIIQRGVQLDLLLNKAENLGSTTVHYRQTATNLSRTMYWRNIKCYVISGICLLLAVYLVVSFSCGGLTWSGCVGAGSSKNSSSNA